MIPGCWKSFSGSNWAETVHPALEIAIFSNFSGFLTSQPFLRCRQERNGSILSGIEPLSEPEWTNFGIKPLVKFFVLPFVLKCGVEFPTICRY